MDRHSKKDNHNQLKLAFDWLLLAEIERKEEAPEAFEASSLAFRQKAKRKAEPSPLWNALLHRDETVFNN